MLVALLGLFLYLDQTYSLEIPVSQLVVAQFTVVSLTLSIVALMANFNDRRIYGYRMSKAVFQSPHLDRLLFFVSIALTFLNLGLLVMKAQPVSVLCVFCTSFGELRGLCLTPAGSVTRSKLPITGRRSSS